MAGRHFFNLWRFQNLIVKFSVTFENRILDNHCMTGLIIVSASTQIVKKAFTIVVNNIFLIAR
jgi:hypothetical protein